MSLLAIIPARGGSRGVPRKNVRLMAGKPLIAWTVAAAMDVAAIDHVIVSTDDAEIAEAAQAAGADVPFMRPDHLSADDTPGIAPVLHAIDMLPGFDEVLLLQPTSPLRSAMQIGEAIALARTNGAPALVSVTEPDSHPAWMMRMDAAGGLTPWQQTPVATRRQELPPVFALNGAIYWAKVDWLRENRSFLGVGTIGYMMDAESSVDIDTPLDWRIAEMLLTGS